MTAAAFVKSLKARGIGLTVDAGRLRVSGWRSLPESDRDRLRALKAEVIELLTQPRLVEPRGGVGQSATRRVVVGQRAESVGGRLTWQPLYLDETTPAFSNKTAGGISELLQSGRIGAGAGATSRGLAEGSTRRTFAPVMSTRFRA